MLTEYLPAFRRPHAVRAFLEQVMGEDSDGTAVEAVMEDLLHAHTSAWCAVYDGEVRAVVGARLRKVGVEDPEYTYMPPRYALAPLSLWHVRGEEDSAFLPDLLEHIRRDALAQGIERVSIDVPMEHTGVLTRVGAAGFVPDVVLAARAAGETAVQGAAAGEVQPPPGVVIRQVVPADEEALLALTLAEGDYHARHTASGIVANQDPEPSREFVRGWLSEDAHLPTFVAEIGGEIVGMLPLVRADHEPQGVIPATYGYVASTYVREDERRRGIGAALLTRALNAARAAGISVLMLHYIADNPSAAPFWQRAGFEPLTVTLTKTTTAEEDIDG